MDSRMTSSYFNDMFSLKMGEQKTLKIAENESEEELNQSADSLSDRGIK